MKRLDKDGYISSLAISMVVVCGLLVASTIFSFWAFMGRQNYKDNADSLIASAVQAEKIKQNAINNQQFNIQQQNPYLSYTGPQQYGSVQISYPKTWSGYVDSTGGSGAPLEAYFDPGVVPGIGNAANLYALRMEINNNAYSTDLANYTQQTTSVVTITPFSLKLVPGVVGVMITGQVQPNKQGIMIMLPLRTTTLEIWTESMQYANQFTTQILPSVSFHP